MKRTFGIGGVHPPDMKELSAQAPLERIPAPDRVVLPVSQHIGAPAAPVVNKGDRVYKGQVVAEATGFVSAPVHASVSGTVAAIEERTTSLGRKCAHIVIDNDGSDEWMGGLNSEQDWHFLEREQMRSAIQEAGLVGMGGAAFPTHVKLSPPENKPIDTLVINGVECEPYLTVDSRLMLERHREVAEGIRILKHLLGVKRTVLGIEANKKEAYAAMKAALRADQDVAVEMLEVKYPQGAEKQLIDAAVGRRVPPGMLPLDVGAVVQNVGTAHAVYEAVAMKRPLIQRPLTITGEGIERPANLIVPIGTPVGQLIERQGLKEGTKKILLGGPMMGVAIYDPELPVVKGTSGILALTKVIDVMPGPCIRCGRCVMVCPMALEATEIKKAVGEGAIERYEHLHVLDCMECGSCAFKCPARLPLVHYIKLAKAELAAWKAKHRK